MADAERAPSVTEQAEDTKEATLPLTPVSDSDGFKHGDHEDHLDAPNGTPVPIEPAHDAESSNEPTDTAEMAKSADRAPAQAPPAAAASPLKPKAAVSVDARTRRTSLQVSKTSKAPTTSTRQVCIICMFGVLKYSHGDAISRGMNVLHPLSNLKLRSPSRRNPPLRPLRRGLLWHHLLRRQNLPQHPASLLRHRIHACAAPQSHQLLGTAVSLPFLQRLSLRLHPHQLVLRPMPPRRQQRGLPPSRVYQPPEVRLLLRLGRRAQRQLRPGHGYLSLELLRP